ncbi:MAG: hypothetical protein PHC75_09175, partial [Burkholderiales bacterium]|nr:hypothetical protein [Burkholderiales bacterium]
DLTVALGYSYNYGISSQLQAIVSSTSIALDVNVADPTLTVGSITSVASPGSAATTVTLSNWYGSSLPASPTLNITLSSNPASGITASACTWTAVPPSGATCTTTLTNDGTAPGGTYQTTATSAGVTSSAQSFVVANPIPAGCANGKKCIFVTNGASNAALGGFAGANDRCKNDSANPLGSGNGSWKALLWGNNSTTAGTNYYQVNGNTVTLIATATSGDLVGLGNAPAAALTITNKYTWVGATGGNCGNWTSSNAGSTTSVGNSGAPNAFWSNSASTATSCAYTLTYLYCVQQ